MTEKEPTVDEIKRFEKVHAAFEALIHAVAELRELPVTDATPEQALSIIGTMAAMVSGSYEALSGGQKLSTFLTEQGL